MNGLPKCAANCGRYTKVYGAKYCPECHVKYSRASFRLQFHPANEPPTEEGDYLLLNKCDGYHTAEAMFYEEDGTFDCFHEMGKPFSEDFYVAWAKLPDSLKDLHPIFVDGDGVGEGQK